ncbi:MAG: TIGR03619 family F420-dependent LLM class oxidoreductase [Ilumatobacteraceae bacterium]
MAMWSMDFGVTIFFTDSTISVTDLATELEARGYASLYLPEHSHIPTSRATAFPLGEPLPEHYRRVFDSIVALTTAAAVTKRLLVGTGISLAMQHHPIEHAKALATLDVISGGRARFGVGYGWNVEEMADHGVAYGTRRAQVREHVLAIHRLWADEVAEFHGEFVDFGPAWQWPKPRQQPRIPTFIGGSPGPKMFAAVSEFADGWMPIGGGGIRESMPALHEAWAAAGRQGAPAVIPFGSVPSPRKVEYYREMGCTHAVFSIPSAGRDEVLAVLDTYQPMIG